jgi:hypothetical protein
MIIEHLGKELNIEFDSTHNGLRVWVYEWDAGRNEWALLSKDLYPLTTPFEALCGIASELYGESVEAEALAQKLGVEMRWSDDVQCEECKQWGGDSEMVLGANMLPEILAETALSNWDYLCEECYIPYAMKVGVDA